MVSRGLAYGVAGAVLAAGGAVLLHYWDMSTIDPWYMVLLVGGSTGLSFTVGYVASFLTEGGFSTPPKDRE